jgi:hypothetical protein
VLQRWTKAGVVRAFVVVVVVFVVTKARVELALSTRALHTTRSKRSNEVMLRCCDGDVDVDEDIKSRASSRPLSPVVPVGGRGRFKDPIFLCTTSRSGPFGFILLRRIQYLDYRLSIYARISS